MQLNNIQELKDVRKKLRKSMPKPEVLVWSMIKTKQCEGVKFRRQYSVGRYIIDFYAPSLKLGIELDGESHYIENKQAKDKERDDFLKSMGMCVVRILNTDIYRNMDGVFDFITARIIERQKELQTHQPPPTPPNLRRGAAP